MKTDFQQRGKGNSMEKERVIFVGQGSGENCLSTCKKKKKKNFNSHFIPHTKIISKWIADLSIRTKAIELLKENRGINLFCLVLGKGFLGH